MNLRPRIDRLARLVRDLGRRPSRCRTCGEPDPGIPESAVLCCDGFQETRPPCARCGQGPALLALDPETGAPEREPRAIFLADPEDLRQGTDAALRAWLDRHRCTDFGPDRNRLVAWLEGG